MAAPRTISGMPLVTPPSRPPARLVGRCQPLLGVVVDDVVCVRAVARRVGVPVAELDRFDRLDAHDRRRQAAVETLVPLAVGAQADRQPVGDDFEDAAERVAGRAGGLDQLGRLFLELLGRRCESATLRPAPTSCDWRHRAARPARPGRPPAPCRRCAHVAADLDPELAQEDLAQRPAATRDAVSRALARSSTLRTSSRPYLTTPARSAWPGRSRVTGGGGSGTGSMSILPCQFAQSLILDDHGDRAAHGPPVAHARDDFDAVVFDLLASAAAVALLASAEIDVDVFGQHFAGRPAGSRRRSSAAGRAIRRRSPRADSRGS